MAPGLQLGINEVSIDRDLKAPTVRRNESEALDHMLELLEQIICQAHGPVGVVSDCTVDDLDLKHDPSRLGGGSAQAGRCGPERFLQFSTILAVGLGANVRKL